VDPEFLRPLFVVLIVGSLVTAIATVALFFAFRAFGGTEAGKSSHFGLIFGLIGFVFLCCLGLLVLSYSGR
jgi:hypothetical protein